MYIEKLNIQSFGGLSDKEIAFENGINVIYGANEAGKSTILAFIKFIFYGISGRKDRLKKYLPLSGDKMCGSIVVADGDNVYEITRNSALTKAKQVKVYNKTTGSEMDLSFAQSIGENLFNMSESTFSNTLFLHDAHLSVDGGDGEINSKLSNMAQSGDEGISQTKIAEKIENDIANYTSLRRKNACIPMLENKISELNSKLFKAKEDEQSIKALENEKEKIKNSIKIKKQEQKLLSDKKTDAVRYLQKIKLSECEKKLENAKNELLNCEKEAQQLDGAKYENIKNITEHEEKDFLTSQDFSKYDTQIIILQEREKNLLSKKKTAFLIMVLGFLASVALLFVNPIFAIALSFVLILGVCLLFNSNKKIAETQNEITELNSKKEENRASISNFLNKVKLSSKDEYISLKNSYAQYLSKYTALNLKAEMLKKDVQFFSDELSKTKAEIIEGFDDKLSDDKIIEIIKNSNCDLSVSELESRLIALSNEISNLEMRFKNLEFEINMKKDTGFDFVKISEEMENAKLTLAEKKNELEIISEAKSIFLSACEEQRSNFAPSLAKKVSEIFSDITLSKHGEILLDEAFDAKIKHSIGYADEEILSEGTLDQLYFSVRFGIIKLVEEKSLPVFLDDAFIRYDEKRLKEVLTFLKDYAKKGQVIISTCHKRETEILEDVNIINI